MVARSFYVYILASRIGGTLYIGVANDLIRRVAEHRLKLAENFTKKYEVASLVYFEQFDDAENAIRGEKRLKKWNRTWKIRLIDTWGNSCRSRRAMTVSFVASESVSTTP